MVHRPRSKPLCAAVLLALGAGMLQGCAVGPDYHAPQMTVPDEFVAPARPASGESGDGIPVKADASPDAGQWWKALGDDTLDGLIDRAIKANPRLEIALTRVQAARQEESVVLGKALPSLGLSAGAARGTGSDLARGRADPTLVAAEDTGNFRHVTEIDGFDFNWELDVFGKYRRELEAAHYDEQAARAARNVVLTSLIADLVRAYVDLRSFQMQRAVLDQNIQLARQYVDFVDQRYQRGLTNGLDLTLAQRQSASLAAQRAPLTARVAAAQFTIAVLCGDFPENVDRELAQTRPVPQLPRQLSTGVPLDLLRRRPDIDEAERELAAANARIGVATADLFPRLAVSAGAGHQVQGWGVNPGMSSFIWSAGPSVSWSILDFGTLDALVNIADLKTHAMLMNYKQTVLTAVEEVDVAASSYAAEQDRLQNLGTALDASYRAVELASQRYERGLTDSLNIIDAQRQQFELEQQYVIAQQSAAEEFITLYKALGGGWERYQDLPPIRQPLPAVLAAVRRSLESDDSASPGK